jgi:hypothetical protein
MAGSGLRVLSCTSARLQQQPSAGLAVRVTSRCRSYFASTGLGVAPARILNDGVISDCSILALLALVAGVEFERIGAGARLIVGPIEF